jgi:hypothetical protein
MLMRNAPTCLIPAGCSCSTRHHGPGDRSRCLAVEGRPWCRSLFGHPRARRRTRSGGCGAACQQWHTGLTRTPACSGTFAAGCPCLQLRRVHRAGARQRADVQRSQHDYRFAADHPVAAGGAQHSGDAGRRAIRCLAGAHAHFQGRRARSRNPYFGCTDCGCEEESRLRERAGDFPCAPAFRAGASKQAEAKETLTEGLAKALAAPLARVAAP